MTVTRSDEVLPRLGLVAGRPAATCPPASVNVIFPEDAMTMTGEPATFIDKGDTGSGVVRMFCGNCGTPLESRSIMSSVAHVVIKAGTFDDPGVFVPDSEVYCKSAMPWWQQGNGRQCYQALADSRRRRPADG